MTDNKKIILGLTKWAIFLALLMPVIHTSGNYLTYRTAGSDECRKENFSEHINSRYIIQWQSAESFCEGGIKASLQNDLRVNQEISILFSLLMLLCIPAYLLTYRFKTVKTSAAAEEVKQLNFISCVVFYMCLVVLVFSEVVILIL